MEDKYILSYLDKNYALYGNPNQTNIFIDGGIDIGIFDLVDIHSGKVYNYYSLEKHIFTIFSDDFTLQEWFNKLSKRGKQIKKTYLDTIGQDKSCDDLIFDASIYFEQQKIFGGEWVKTLITEEYLEKVIKPRINDFVIPLTAKFQSKTIIKKVMKHFLVSNVGLLGSYISKTVLSLYKSHLLNKIKTHLNNMDINSGSIILFKKFKNSFNYENDVFKSLIRSEFKVFYESKIEKFINSYIESLDITKNLTCNQIKIGYPRYDIELLEFSQIIIDAVNKWYNINVLNPKIDDFLSQLIVSLGKNDWKTYWIGHGLLTESKMKLYFREEDYQENYIQIRYDNWYENAVILACEKELNFK
tara:strand:- start:14432 stop:15505 length:1074 start_codon:yes stop_codon:yes gene_type:complete